IGTVLLVNLIAAHIKRFNLSWSKLGIHLTHLGVILLLVGQLTTDMFSKERYMRLTEGQTRQYSESHRGDELVFLKDAGTGMDQVVSIPESMVRRAAAKKTDIDSDELPFTVRVKAYYPNCEIASHSAIAQTAAQLQSALAMVEGSYSAPETLSAQVEKADETGGRRKVWEEALRAVGEDDVANLQAAVQRVVANPETAKRLSAELKTRFQAQMLEAFRREGGAKRIAADRLAKNEPTTEDALAPAAGNGAGKIAMLVPLAEVKDTDTRNFPAAVVEILAQGKSLGTWLLTPWLNDQPLDLPGGGNWRAAFRFQRTYYPFAVQLLKTTHEIYRGTATAANPEGIPKNFQSRVRIENPQTSENREVDIYMNNPLRYHGLTFYQYQMGQDEVRGGAIGTSTLQVVRNPSWLTPYIGCIVVGLGMLYQFLFHLVRFITRRRDSAPQPAAA
ncbi:MAG: cytochrome c biogenesis protein ResB, partial [Chthoniobacteraceae bacterium]